MWIEISYNDMIFVSFLIIYDDKQVYAFCILKGHNWVFLFPIGHSVMLT